MRKITTMAYKFEELSAAAKETAIEKYRSQLYEYNDFAEWAIDDCYLFEPKHAEIERLFKGKDPYKTINKGQKYTDTPIIGNTRKNIYFDCDRGQFLDCEQAMEINNEYYFLLWLGVSSALQDKISFSIYTPSGRGRDTAILFELQDQDEDITGPEEEILSDAVDKFDSHIQDVLRRIGESIEYRFSGEAVLEEIEANEYEFNEAGEQV